jgi:hypothetical protein
MAMVYTGIVILVLIGFVGLALDWGYVFWVANGLQTAADSAALAGAQKLKSSQVAARSAAVRLAGKNLAGPTTVPIDRNDSNNANGDVVIGKYDRATHTFTPSTDPDPRTGANAVRVLARRNQGSRGGPLPLFFGPIFGKKTANVARFAVAVAEGDPGYADIVALNSHDPSSFYVHTSGYLNVRNGEGQIQVNSNNRSNNLGGSTIQGANTTVLAGDLYVVGTNEQRGNSKPGLPEIHEGADYQSDPLAGLAEPAVPSQPVDATHRSITGVYDFNPGYYPDGIRLTSGTNAYLKPGVYIIDNGWDMMGGKMYGYGVMIYMHTGAIHNRGNDNGGAVQISPPGPGEYYHGISIFQARTNTASVNFNGGTLFKGYDDPHTALDEGAAGAGTFYLPSAKVEFGGTADMWFNGLIADKIEVYGNGKVNVTGGYNTNKGTLHVYLME